MTPCPCCVISIPISYSYTSYSCLLDYYVGNLNVLQVVFSVNHHSFGVYFGLRKCSIFSFSVFTTNYKMLLLFLLCFLPSKIWTRNNEGYILFSFFSYTNLTKIISKVETRWHFCNYFMAFHYVYFCYLSSTHFVIFSVSLS